MSDPRRWSERGEESELTRDLLLAAQERRMPDSERRAVWASISLALPVASSGLGLGASAPAAAKSALSAYLTKGLIFLATLGGVTVAALQFWPSEAKAPAPTVLAASPRVPSAPLPVAPPEPPTPESAPPEPVAAAPNAAKTRVASESQLREESLAVLAARSALRSGNAQQSLALLEQARLRFPRGALGQEREALTINALAKSGQTTVAKRRAEAFLRAHPSSPYVADVRRVAGQ